MWIENKIFHEDMEQIAQSEYIPWEKFSNKTILITGATGLIGFNLVSALAYVSLFKNVPMKIYALVRNLGKAKGRFDGALQQGAPITFVLGELNNVPRITEHIDYVIHGASPTESSYFAAHPVETIQMNLRGASTLLEIAKKNHSEGFIFLSSMEVYGSVHEREEIKENHESFVDTMSPRSCYPEAKRMIESLCASYASEYDVPTRVIRLAQTFGAGIRENENRVFAQFARSAMKNENIILFTPGGSERNYLYTADAVTAILTALLLGKNGEAYNAANENTYCSIKSMATTVANLEVIKKKYGGPVSVVIDDKRNNGNLYPPESYIDLNTDKLQALGWRPMLGFKEMFTRMIEAGIKK